MKKSPLFAIGCGLFAGAVGAGVQNLFFRATTKLAPKTPNVFTPPDSRDPTETPTAIVARRTVEGLMQRGPLSKRATLRGARIVHYSYGALWGAAFGIVRESAGRPLGPIATKLFGAVVWAASDTVILPLHRLAASPNKYPPRAHLYALISHFAYAAGVSASYELVRSRGLVPVVGFYLEARALRRAPALARPFLRGPIRLLARSRARRPFGRVRRGFAELRA